MIKREDQNPIFEILPNRLEFLEEKIKKLNKKAKKVQAEEVGYKVLRKVEKLVRERDANSINAEGEPVLVYFEVEVYGAAPKLNGWELLAVLQHEEAGTVVRNVPDKEFNEEPYRNRKAWCEHCNKVRNRKDTFLVRHENGEIKQVARNCLRDFLGHHSPERLAYWAEFLAEAEGFMSDGGGGGQTLIDTPTYLTFVAECVDRYGWVPKSAAGEGRPATANVAVEEMFPSREKIKKGTYMKPSEKSRKEAKEVLEWGEELAERENKNDYIFKLSVLIQKEFLDFRDLGIVGSSVAAFRREKERELEFAKKRKTWADKCAKSAHFGEIKKRENFELKLTDRRTIYSDFGEGFEILTFEDKNDNVAVWFTRSASKELECGSTYEIRATVKRHDEYKGLKQTILTRCAVEKFIKGEEAA